MAFTLCEIWFRAHPDPLPAEYYRHKIEVRLWKEWLNEKTLTCFPPPLKSSQIQVLITLNVYVIL